jgi:hypothetical protein
VGWLKFVLKELSNAVNSIGHLPSIVELYSKFHLSFFLQNVKAQGMDALADIPCRYLFDQRLSLAQ